MADMFRDRIEESQSGFDDEPEVTKEALQAGQGRRRCHWQQEKNRSVNLLLL